MEKKIKGFEDYAITEDGKVISYKYKEPRVLSTWYQKAGYENVGLSNGNGKTNKLVHRLVGEAFIPNPNNLPEIHHIDGNPKNNNMENLEWCDRKTNLEKSSIGFARNVFSCRLEKESGELVKQFPTITSACEWASENLGCSKTYLQRKTGNLSNGYRVVKESV